MKLGIGILLGLLVSQLPTLYAHQHKVVTEVQYNQTGSAYNHGDHCIDGRVF